jgi:hypothetical protein
MGMFGFYLDKDIIHTDLRAKLDGYVKILYMFSKNKLYLPDKKELEKRLTKILNESCW